MQSDELKCDVKNLNYDFESCVGRLFIADDATADINACISMFERIDRRVKRVALIAGAKLIAIHERSTFGWAALDVKTG